MNLATYLGLMADGVDVAIPGVLALTISPPPPPAAAAVSQKCGTTIREFRSRLGMAEPLEEEGASEELRAQAKQIETARRRKAEAQPSPKYERVEAGSLYERVLNFVHACGTPSTLADIAAGVQSKQSNQYLAAVLTYMVKRSLLAREGMRGNLRYRIGSKGQPIGSQGNATGS